MTQHADRTDQDKLTTATDALCTRIEEHHVPGVLWTNASYLKRYRADWREGRIR